MGHFDIMIIGGGAAGIAAARAAADAGCKSIALVERKQKQRAAGRFHWGRCRLREPVQRVSIQPVRCRR